MDRPETGILESGHGRASLRHIRTPDRWPVAGENPTARRTGRADPISEHRNSTRRTAARRARLPAHSFGLPLANSVRPSPARATPADRGAWLPVLELTDLPELEDLLEPHCLVAPRSARTEGNVRPTPVRPRPTARPSPARARPADPGSWLPVPDVDLLPELEELLAPDKLVPEPVPEARTAPSTPPAPLRIDPVAREPIEHEPVERRRVHAPPVVREAPTRAPAPEPAPSSAADALTRAQLRSESAHRRVRRRGRHALILAGALVVAIALSGVLLSWFRTTTPTVDLTVDGHRISVRTDAGTVGGLLREHGVRPSASDRLTPRAGAKVSDGLNVVLQRARPVKIERDGQMITVTSAARTPAELLRELGVSEHDVALIDPPRSLDYGQLLRIRTIKTVNFTADGTTILQRTPAMTVKELLTKNGVVLNPLDTVSPSADTSITDGMNVVVGRTTGEVETADEDVPFTTEKRDDPNLPFGQQKTIQHGVVGKNKVTYQITRSNGEVVGRSPISAIPIEPMVPEIIAVGTKAPGGGGAASGSSAGAPNSGIAPGGGQSVTGSASWYQSPFGDDSCATKEYIPKGTIIRVTNLDTGQSVNCRVADRVEADRAVDMDKEGFAQLAPNSQGVFPTRVDW